MVAGGLRGGLHPPINPPNLFQECNSKFLFSREFSERNFF
jgi:hypothetical protein